MSLGLKLGAEVGLNPRWPVYRDCCSDNHLVIITMMAMMMMMMMEMMTMMMTKMGMMMMMAGVPYSYNHHQQHRSSLSHLDDATGARLLSYCCIVNKPSSLPIHTLTMQRARAARLDPRRLRWFHREVPVRRLSP